MGGVSSYCHAPVKHGDPLPRCLRRLVRGDRSPRRLHLPGVGSIDRVADVDGLGVDQLVMVAPARARGFSKVDVSPASRHCWLLLRSKHLVDSYCDTLATIRATMAGTSIGTTLCQTPPVVCTTC